MRFESGILNIPLHVLSLLSRMEHVCYERMGDVSVLIQNCEGEKELANGNPCTD